MRRVLAFALGLAVLAAPRAVRADVFGAAPTGLWLTADRTAVIQITPCQAGLCGAIVGLYRKHPGDPMPQDWRGRPLCGMTIIETAPLQSGISNTVWKGVVLDPRNGNLHPALLRLDAFRRLVLRGYVLLPIFGESQIWTAFTGQALQGCRLAS